MTPSYKMAKFDGQSVSVETYHLAENNLRGILRQVRVKSAWVNRQKCQLIFNMLPEMAEALVLSYQARVWPL